MGKSKKIVFILLLLIILTSIYLASLAKNKLQFYLERTLKTKVGIGSVSLNIFTASIILNNLAIEDLLKIRQIVIRPEIKPLLHGRFTISRIILDKPDLIIREFGTKPSERILLPAKEILIKNGTLRYKTAYLQGIFIHIKNYPIPISYTQDIPFFTRIKARGYLPAEPKGAIALSGNVNLAEPVVSFTGNISMDNISLPYFNNFYPEDSMIRVVSGEFSLKTKAQCIRNQLMARPGVIVRNLRLKLTQDYTTGEVFKLPVVLVVDFFDLYKEELRFTFEVSGSLSSPEFKLNRVISQQVSEVIGTSIVRKIATSPALIVKLGDKLAAIADKLKNFGLELGKGAGKALEQLGKPAKIQRDAP